MKEPSHVVIRRTIVVQSIIYRSKVESEIKRKSRIRMTNPCDSHRYWRDDVCIRWPLDSVPVISISTVLGVDTFSHVIVILILVGLIISISWMTLLTHVSTRDSGPFLPQVPGHRHVWSEGFWNTPIDRSNHNVILNVFQWVYMYIYVTHRVFSICSLIKVNDGGSHDWPP